MRVLKFSKRSRRRGNKMAKYSIFFKITEPLFFIETNFQTQKEAEEDFKLKLARGTEFSLKLNDKNVKILKVFDRDF